MWGRSITLGATLGWLLPATMLPAAMLLATTLLAASAGAQAVRTQADIVWGTFVGGPGRTPARADVPGEPGTLDLGDSPWSCGYGRVRHAAISESDWSVQRVLACRREQATVSATASCRVRDGRVEEHAATLSLGSVDDTRHVTVTLGCRGR